MVKVGDELPDAHLVEGKPNFGEPEVHSLHKLIKGNTAVIFAVCGAFTPTCSKAHLPSFIEHYDELKAAGVDVVICTSTNDAYVMHAWAEASGVKPGTILMLSDKDAKFATAISEANGSVRHKKSFRYALIAKDGIVTHFFPAEKHDEHPGFENTCAPHVLEALKQSAEVKIGTVE